MSAKVRDSDKGHYVTECDYKLVSPPFSSTQCNHDGDSLASGDERSLPLPPSFWDKVDKRPDGCWHWTGSMHPGGYGRFGKGQYGSRLAHRLTYLALVGPIPVGLTLDHLCRVRHCVNPDHLEPVTHTENLRRGYWAQATHCVNGHPWAEPNMYRDHEGKRRCRACNRERQRSYRQRAAENPERVTHGVASTYEVLGCRCDECREASRLTRKACRERKASA